MYWIVSERLCTNIWTLVCSVTFGHKLVTQLPMDVYNFSSDSESSDGDIFEGFNAHDVTRAGEVQNAVNCHQLSSVSSASSSSSESDSDNSDSDLPPIDVRVDPPDWTTDFVPIHVPPFTLQSGPNLPHGWDIYSTPLKYFQLFFTPQIIDEIVQHTNSYAEISIKKKRDVFPTFQDKQWSLDGSNNLTLDELSAYLGCCLILSANPAHQLKHVFSSDPYMYNHGIRSVFTLRRFTKIGRYICICDKKNEPGCNSPQYDKMYKIKNIVHHLNTTFPKYYMFSESQAIDESLVKTKCHLSEIQYCPDKPACRGLKVWCRCDSKNSTSCYLFRFEPYMGKKHTNVSNNGLYHDVVYRLCSDLKGSNVKLYFDNLYNSLALIQNLQRDGIWALGTIHSNRIGLHPNVQKPPKLVRGEHKMYQDKKNPNLTCCVWQDTKPVRYASVACDPSIVGVAIHRISRNYVRVNQPLVSQQYNQHYKSIDLFDQYLSAYPISRRTHRSWKHIWWFCFQASVINAYILYKETHPGPLPKSYSHLDFRIALGKEMIGNFSNRQQNPFTKPLFIGPDAPGRNEQFINHENKKLDPPKLRVCKPHKKYHGVTKHTVYACESCSVSLCKNCHVRWHNPNMN